MSTPHEVLQNAVKTFLTPYFRNVFKNIYIKSCFDANNAEAKIENGSKIAYTEYMKGIRYCVENNVASQNSINVVDIIEESKKFCSEDIIKSMFKLIICDVFNSCMDLPENQINIDKFIRRIIMICCDFLQPNFDYFEHKHYNMVDEIVKSAIEHATYRSIDLNLLTSAYLTNAHLTSTQQGAKNSDLQKDLLSIKEHQKNIEIDIKNIPLNNHVPQQIPIQFIVPGQKNDSESTSKKDTSSSSSSSSSSKKSSSPLSSNHEQISKLIFDGEDSYNFESAKSERSSLKTDIPKTDALHDELNAVNQKMFEMEKLKADFEKQQKELEKQNVLLKSQLDKKKKVDVHLPIIQYGDATLAGDVKSLNQPTNTYKEKIYESFDA